MLKDKTLTLVYPRSLMKCDRLGGTYFTWTGGSNLHSHALCYAHCDSRECVSRRSSALFSTHTFQAVWPAEISLKPLPTIMYEKDTKKGPVTFAFQNITFTDERHPQDTLIEV